MQKRNHEIQKQMRYKTIYNLKGESEKMGDQK